MTYANRPPLPSVTVRSLLFDADRDEGISAITRSVDASAAAA